MMMKKKRQHAQGFTLVDMLAVLSSGVVVLSCLTVVQDEQAGQAHVLGSMKNLKNFGVAHHTYAAEWNGRQMTTAPDNLSEILKEHAGGHYPVSYSALSEHVPAVPLGFTAKGEFISSHRGYLVQPFYYVENCSLGSFRLWNTSPFTNYINGRAFDASYWAPDDYTVGDELKALIESPGQWPSAETSIHPPTYCLSTAAMFHPDVFRAKSRGGFQDPRELPNGFRSPGLRQTRYPDLKTHMLEHLWLRDRPSDWIPGLPNTPWFFNLGAKSRPATLFYDGHVRMLPVEEVLASNQRQIDQQADPLWVEKEDACFSGSGYFDAYAQNKDERTSFHVFTADGIMGRDVLLQE